MRRSDCPKALNSISLLSGEASIGVTSTNSLPPALYMGAAVVNRKKDKPNGFMGSVIIC